MGYSTDFIGDLKFRAPLDDEMMSRIKQVFSQDVRNHPDWEIPQTKYGSPEFYWIDFELNDSSDGIEWSGSEKSYSMEMQAQFIIDWMRKEYPDFELWGVMEAQGEDTSDHWFLVAEGDKTSRIEMEEYFTTYKNKKLIPPTDVEYSIT